MEKKLKILILEDNKIDCELIEKELSKGGFFTFTSKRVEDRESFSRELRDFLPDVILADYNLPSFNAVAALEMTLEFSRLIPFIVVTGSVSEEIAVECMKAGASDYIIKDRLTRLSPAVAKALEKTKIEKEKEAVIEALRQSEQKYRTIFDVSPEVIIVIDSGGIILDVNRVIVEYTGHSREEVIGKNIMQLPFVAGHSRNVILTNFEMMLKGEKIFPYEVEFISGEGRSGVARLYTETLKSDNNTVSGAVAVLFDITDQRESENSIRRERDRARAYFESAGVMFLVLDSNQNIELINKRGCEILGYKAEELIGKNWFEMCLPERFRDEVRSVWNSLMAGEISLFERLKGIVRTKSGMEKVILWNNSLVKDESGAITGILASGEDITEMENVINELKKTLSALKEFKDLTVGRENRMIDLKREINKLSDELGRPRPYDVPLGE